MNKFLIALLILLFFSCEFKNKNNSINSNIQVNATSIQVNPQSFIPELPGRLKENSGLILFDGLLWTINDSGGRNIIYGFNFSGEIEKEIEIENAKNIDWESISQDQRYIYIGDFGNNNGNRKNQTIYKIKKRDINKKKSKQKLNAEIIAFRFENQKNFTFQPKRTAFDCEALIATDSSLYIFTKDWSDRKTTVYKIPKETGNYMLKPIEIMNVNALITGASVSPDKTKLALIGYKDYNPIVWLFSNFSSDNFFNGDKIRINLDSVYNAQTEGICFLNNDSLLISCERTFNFDEQVFFIDLKTIK